MASALPNAFRNLPGHLCAPPHPSNAAQMRCVGMHGDAMHRDAVHGDVMCGDAMHSAAAPSRPAPWPWARKGLFSIQGFRQSLAEMLSCLAETTKSTTWLRHTAELTGATATAPCSRTLSLESTSLHGVFSPISRTKPCKQATSRPGCNWTRTGSTWQEATGDSVRSCTAQLCLL